MLIDPFLTGNPRRPSRAEELSPDAILLTHGHADHIGDTVSIATDQRSASSGAEVVAIVEIANELTEAGVQNVHDPNLGGTVTFDWGWVRLVPAWHTSTTPKGTVNTPAGLVVGFARQDDLPPRRHRALLRPRASRAARADRRGADVHRGPLHDGPLRRRARPRGWSVRSR